MVNQGRIKSRKTTFDKRVTLSYVLSEGEKEETILFIHGLNCSKKYLLPILDYPELSSYNVLIPDLVGHGDSSTPKNFSFSMDDQAKILRARHSPFGDHVDIPTLPDSVNFLGSSFGLTTKISLSILFSLRFILPRT